MSKNRKKQEAQLDLSSTQQDGCAESLKMLPASLCVIKQCDKDKSSPVALYFPDCSSFSHLAYSGPALLECYKNLFHCLSWCCGKQKWTFSPLDSVFYCYNFRLNLHPKNSNKIGKHINGEKKKCQMLIIFPFQQFFLALKMSLMLKATFHPQKLLFCFFRKYTVLRMCFISLTLWSWDNSTFRRVSLTVLFK